MNKLYPNETPPLPKLFRVILMPPKESLTGDKENSPWDKRESFIVRADDPGAPRNARGISGALKKLKMSASRTAHRVTAFRKGGGLF